MLPVGRLTRWYDGGLYGYAWFALVVTGQVCLLLGLKYQSDLLLNSVVPLSIAGTFLFVVQIFKNVKVRRAQAMEGAHAIGGIPADEPVAEV